MPHRPDILNPHFLRSATIGSVATDSSSYFPLGPLTFAGEVLSAYLVNGTTNSIASGTTSGSAVTINLYKNASNAASVVASFNGSGTAVATLGTQSLTFSGTSNSVFAAGDSLIGEFVGGAANNVSNAGCYIVVNYMYGRQNGSVPAAATGPA